MRLFLLFVTFFIGSNVIYTQDCDSILVEVSQNYNSLSLQDIKDRIALINKLDLDTDTLCTCKSNALIWLSYKAQELNEMQEMENSLLRVEEAYKECFDTIPLEDKLDLNQRRINLYRNWGKFEKSKSLCKDNISIVEDLPKDSDMYAEYMNLVYQVLGEIALAQGQIHQAISHITVSYTHLTLPTIYSV